MSPGLSVYCVYHFLKAMMKFLAPLDSERTLVVQDEEEPLPPYVRARLAQKVDMRARYAEHLRGRRGADSPAQSSCVVRARLGTGVEGLMEVGNEDRCQLQGRVYSGEFFVYLLTHSEPSRTNSFVGVSVNPLREVCVRNAASTAPGHWALDIAQGPHTCRETAYDCGLSLVTDTRGAEPKRNKFPWLSAAYNAPIYTYTHAPALPLPQLLAHYAEPEFLRLYCELYEPSEQACQ